MLLITPRETLRLGIGLNVLGTRWAAGMNSSSLLGCLWHVRCTVTCISSALRELSIIASITLSYTSGDACSWSTMMSNWRAAILIGNSVAAVVTPSWERGWPFFFYAWTHSIITSLDSVDVDICQSPWIESRSASITTHQCNHAENWQSLRISCRDSAAPFSRMSLDWAKNSFDSARADIVCGSWSARRQLVR